MARTILVTGATGRLGALVAAGLTGDDDVAVRVLVRPARIDAGAFADQAVDVVAGDYDDPETLRAAVAGADGVFLVSPVHPDMRRRESALVDAVRDVSPAAKLVKISGLGTRLDSFVDSGRWHAEIEAHIRSTGVLATCLRPNFFMQNLAFQARTMAESGEIRSAVEDARIAMVDARDIADVAIAVLTRNTVIDGRSVGLTSERSYDYVELARIFGEAFGRTIEYRRTTDDDVRAMLEKGGQPAWHRRIILSFNAAFRQGWGAEVSSAVSDVLGRAPRSVEAFARELATGGTVGGADPFPS